MAKKRGRPKGSKNKPKKKVASDVNNAFGEAFGHVEAEPMLRDVANDDEEAFFGVNDSLPIYEGDMNSGTLEEMVAATCELDDAPTYENQHDESEEQNIGFGEADVFDVEELIGLAGETQSDD